MSNDGAATNSDVGAGGDAGPTEPRLIARTVRLDHDLPLVEIGARSGLLWSRQGFTLAGVGRAARLPLDRPGGFATASSTLAAMSGQSELDGVGTGAVAFAALPFDPDQRGELVVPELVFGANEAGQRWLTEITPADTTDPTSTSTGAASTPVDVDVDVDVDIAAALSVIEELLAEEQTGPEAVLYELRSGLTPEQWRDDVVAAAVERITNGELDKAVFARELILRTDRPIPAPAVVQRLQNVFPSAALFLVEGFVGASPELLVARHDDVVRAHPLAGTAARSSDPAVDQRQIGGLLSSEKDRWEHRITIDWLLDTLLPFCSYVDAEPEPSIVTLANVHHLGTLVEGRLSSPAAPILELVAALHPTPAVGGSPQKEALTLIGELEMAERGRYAGPTGWVDGAGNGQFAVAIRSAELGQEETRLFAGVGVVNDSDPQAELDETRAKFRAMLGALVVP